MGPGFEIKLPRNIMRFWVKKGVAAGQRRGGFCWFAGDLGWFRPPAASTW